MIFGDKLVDIISFRKLKNECVNFEGRIRKYIIEFIKDYYLKIIVLFRFIFFI